MKATKLVIISIIAIGFTVWVWTNQSNSVIGPAKSGFVAANSQIFHSRHSGSASDSAAQNQIADNAAQSSNLSLFFYDTRQDL